MTTLQDFGGVLGRPLDTSFWAVTIHGHGSWLVCEVTLSYIRMLADTKLLQTPRIVSMSEEVHLTPSSNYTKVKLQVRRGAMWLRMVK